MTDRHPTRSFAEGRDPTPVGGVTTEQIRDLARCEAEAEGRRQQQECVETGPVCALWKGLETMRKDVDDLKLDRAEIRAVLNFQKWFLPIMVTVAVFIAGVIVPRIWPVQPAQASQGRPAWHQQADQSAGPEVRK
jgi:hypothetical protein